MFTPTFPTRIPNELLQELGEFAGVFWCGEEVEEVICEAIRAYMKRAPADQAQQPATGTNSVDTDTGYQWKQVFLPEGTRLRASFGKTPYTAVVQGGQLRCGEQALSPSAFANLHGGGNRNAWRAIWLRFPDSEQWVLADTCRELQKTAITRLF